MSGATKVQVHIRQALPTAPRDLAATVAQELRRAAMESDAISSWTVMEAAADGALRRSSFGSAVGHLQPFHLVLDLHLRGTAEASAGVLRNVLGATNGQQLFDVQTCSVLSGTEHVMIQGGGRLVFQFFLRRRPSLTRAAFGAYWRHRHTRRNVPRLGGYRQFHVDYESTSQVASSVGVTTAEYDGVAVAFYSSVEHFLEVSGHPSIAIDARADERNFIDHTGSAVALLVPVAASESTSR